MTDFAYAGSYAYAYAYSVWNWTGAPGMSTPIHCSLSIHVDGEVMCLGYTDDWYCHGTGITTAMSQVSASARGIAENDIAFGDAYAWGCATGMWVSSSGGVGKDGDGYIETDPYFTWWAYGNYGADAWFEVSLSDTYDTAPGAAIFDASTDVDAGGYSVGSIIVHQGAGYAEADTWFDCSGSSSVNVSW